MYDTRSLTRTHKSRWRISNPLHVNVCEMQFFLCIELTRSCVRDTINNYRKIYDSILLTSIPNISRVIIEASVDSIQIKSFAGIEWYRRRGHWSIKGPTPDDHFRIQSETDSFKKINFFNTTWTETWHDHMKSKFVMMIRRSSSDTTDFYTE